MHHVLTSLKFHCQCVLQESSTSDTDGTCAAVAPQYNGWPHITLPTSGCQMYILTFPFLKPSQRRSVSPLDYGQDLENCHLTVRKKSTPRWRNNGTRDTPACLCLCVKKHIVSYSCSSFKRGCFYCVWVCMCIHSHVPVSNTQSCLSN